MKAQELTDFEQEIADIYSKGTIRAPIHLRGSEDFAYENNLIQIFNQYYTNGDYIFGYWGQHLHALLAGIPKEKLKQRIIDGDSISLIFPEHNFYCSGIVGSLVGSAVGVAWNLKRQQSKQKVLHFCGDMGSFGGIFRESVEYAINFDLPIVFVVEDNGVSVTTNTKKTWNYDKFWFDYPPYTGKTVYYKYINKFKHSGLQAKVAF